MKRFMMRRSSPAVVALAIIIAGCSGGASAVLGPELFTFSATSEATFSNPMWFKTTATVTNGTNGPIEYVPACPIPRVLVYTTPARTGAPFWDSNSLALPCPLQMGTALAAGESRVYAFNGMGSAVLGAAGAPGTYYVVAEINLSGIATRVSAGQLNITR
jgi:hypothetical protein